ncbi:unnamed protein product [Cyclocybe aegerita]|uniref:HECT-type E3 ubiquitin transferase n=1 Tax=Cyclocybe aegerita TaxID=1973307 RepID=A0A8S0XYE7_CYCAE|nr:unnamed protein product [Cyclocybe aegerita]
MFPNFDSERRRKINLGGASSSSSSTSILRNVHAEREARAAHRLRTDSATRIQAWYRGVKASRRTREEMKAMFEADVKGLTGLRCLVLICRRSRAGKNMDKLSRDGEEALSRWAGEIGALGPHALWTPVLSSSPAVQSSWLALIRQVGLILVRAVSESPQSPRAMNYLSILNSLLSKDIADAFVGAGGNGSTLVVSITEYLVARGFYALLGRAIERIPSTSKKSPTYPPLLALITLPLSTFAASSPQYASILAQLVAHVLSVPLLLNRLPLDELPNFVARLPLAQLQILQSHFDELEVELDKKVKDGDGGAKVHLVATLYMLLSPRYKILPVPALEMYLRLSARLLNGFPAGIFVSPSSTTATATQSVKKGTAGKKKAIYDSSSSDSEDEHPTRVSVVSSFSINVPSTPPPPPVVLDTKTLARLQKIAEPVHLSSLISATQSKPTLFRHLIGYLFALTQAWARAGTKYSSSSNFASPSSTSKKGGKKGSKGEEEVLRAILASAGPTGGLIRELYRVLVRAAPVGKDEVGRDVLDPVNAAHYPSLLLLADLYSQALQTMGDDEFFGTSSSSLTSTSGSANAARNPLTLDELVSLSKQLLNIAFVLYWRDDSAFVGADSAAPTTRLMETLVSTEVRCTWEAVREKVTRCLLAVHARDSRRPFAPPDHWLVTSHLGVNSENDMHSFVEAAVMEDQQLSLQSDFPSYLNPRGPGRLNAARNAKMQARFAQALTPRLGILNNIPFAVPFEVRVRIFREFVHADAYGHEHRAHSRRSRSRRTQAINPVAHLRNVLDEVADDLQEINRGLDTIAADLGNVDSGASTSQSSGGPAPVATTRRRVAIDAADRIGRMMEEDFERLQDGQRHHVDDLGRAALDDLMSEVARSMDVDAAEGGDLDDQLQAIDDFFASAARRSSTTPRNPGQPGSSDTGPPVTMGPGGRPRVPVRRGMVAQDGFDKLSGVDLKQPVEIVFVDQWGQEEAGIDGGGVFKEFFTSLCKEVFDTDRGLWLANKKNELYPNPHAYATEAHSLNWYRFIGRILGKAMYEGILVDVAFAGFFLAKWLGRQSFLDDLASLDPELYNGLIFLKHHAGNPEDLSLNFTVAIEEFGVTKTIDLIPNGSNITVTRENRLQYIFLVSHYRLSKQIKLQSEAFFEGLSEMIDRKWLRMFNQTELQLLLGGTHTPISVDDLRANTSYGGLYESAHPTILIFWNVLSTFSQADLRAFLRFVTSCSRPPLLGFRELRPGFAIRDAGGDQARLPSASTCVNLLKLPRYESSQLLKEKLLKAIWAGAGFDLS